MKILVSIKNIVECFKSFYQETESLSQTLTSLRFMTSNYLVDWIQKKSAESLIDTVNLLKDIGLIKHSCKRLSTDRPAKRQRCI